jgi:O-glycosyl hydrolase
MPAGEGALSDSALGLGLKIHQALTTGRESAWVYWQLLDDAPVSVNTLSDATLRERAPKYIAAKHFFRFIRPGAVRVEAKLGGESAVQASAYFHQASRMLTLVLVHTGASTESLLIKGLEAAERAEVYTSEANKLWQHSELKQKGATTTLRVPAHGMVTLVAHLH